MASMRPFPWLARMVLADPTGVVPAKAFQHSVAAVARPYDTRTAFAQSVATMQSLEPFPKVS